MQVSLNKAKSKTSAFTLIEMIGVLAVIGILAALLIPKIFEAINNARINSAAASIAAVKTAVADHYAKFGSLQSSNGSPLSVASPVLGFDTILLNEQFIDKPLSVKIADPTNTFVELVPDPLQRNRHRCGKRLHSSDPTAALLGFRLWRTPTG